MTLIQLIINARKKGPDNEYLKFIRRQPSCLSGQFSEYVNGEGRCEAAHVRRAGESGMGFKSEYACIPLTRFEHALQHQKGEIVLISRFMPGKWTNWKAKKWFDQQRVRYLEMWIDS